MTLDFQAAPAERIDCGDATLVLRRFGQGPALLLVHGFPLHGYTWRQLLPELAREFTCYVPDSAGMGDSEWSASTEFSWDGHSRRLMALLDRLGVARCGLIAQDTGATIARRLALMQPERFSSLVMFNTEIPGHRPPWIPLYQWQFRHLPGTAAAFRLLLRSRAFLRSGMGFGGCFCDLDRIDGDFHAAFVAPLLRSPARIDGLGRYLTGLYWDFVDSLARRHGELTMPSLLIWGQDDPTFPIALARGMAAQLPDCRGLVEIPDARLLVHEERPAPVLEAVLPFLRQAS